MRLEGQYAKLNEQGKGEEAQKLWEEYDAKMNQWGTTIPNFPDDPLYDMYSMTDKADGLGEALKDREMSAILFNDSEGNTWQVNYFDTHKNPKPPIMEIFEQVKNKEIIPIRSSVKLRPNNSKPSSSLSSLPTTASNTPSNSKPSNQIDIHHRSSEAVSKRRKTPARRGRKR